MRKTPDQIRSEITGKIVEAIKAGTPPWRQPWINHPNAGIPRNFQTSRHYTGVNPIVLLLEGAIKGFKSQMWGTAHSWTKAIGVHVKKGEHGSHITLLKTLKEKDKETGKVVKTATGKDKTFSLLREYVVFNAEQMQAPTAATLLGVPHPLGIVNALLGGTIKGKRKTPTTKAELLTIASKYLPAKGQPDDRMTRDQIAEAITVGITARLTSYWVAAKVINTEPDFQPAEEFFKATGADIRHGHAEAFYRQKPGDFIGMPDKRTFLSMTDYYQTGCHELVHWSEADGRVGRDEDTTYAFNELVAEIGSCFTLSALGVPGSEKMLPKSAAYVEFWLKEMAGDPKFIFKAASKASKCSDYLLAFVGKANPAYVPEGEDGEEPEGEERRVA